MRYRGSAADVELGSHHGSQQGSAAVSSHEGDAEGGEGEEPDADEVAAKADFTPMTDEKRIFVTEWIAKLGDEGFDDDAVSSYTAHLTLPSQSDLALSCLYNAYTHI